MKRLVHLLLSIALLSFGCKKDEKEEPVPTRSVEYEVECIDCDVQYTNASGTTINVSGDGGWGIGYTAPKGHHVRLRVISATLADAKINVDGTTFLHTYGTDTLLVEGNIP